MIESYQLDGQLEIEVSQHSLGLDGHLHSSFRATEVILNSQLGGR